jgi:Holliday junction resolvase-like predicted endonuclease
MQKGQNLYFVEVKYRKNNFAGGGLQSISATKLKQMELASEEFLDANQQYHNYQAHLSAIELSGKPPKITQFIADIELDV